MFNNEQTIANITPPILFLHNLDRSVFSNDQIELMSAPARTFLLDLIEHHRTHSETSVLGLEELQKVAVKQATKNPKKLIQKRIRELDNYGLIAKTQVQRPGQRRVTVYTLVSNPNINTDNVRSFEHHKCSDNRQAIKRAKNKEAANVVNLDDFVISQKKSESFVTGNLDKAMRINSKDPRTKVKSTFMYKGEQVQILAQCAGDKGLMFLADQVVTRALITLISQYIEDLNNRQKNDLFAETLEVKNEFDIDIADLCRVLGKTPCGSSRDMVREALYRMDQTRFEIRCKPMGEFSKDYTGGYDRHSFSFFKDLKAASDIEGMEYRKDRFFRLELNDYTYRIVADKNARKLFTAHPNVFDVKSGVIQSLYNLCRIAIGNGRKNQELKTLRYDITKLRAQVFPMYDADKRLWNDLCTHLKKYAVDPSSWDSGTIRKARALGYEFTLSPKKSDERYISMRLDLSDQYFVSRGTQSSTQTIGVAKTCYQQK